MTKTKISDINYFKRGYDFRISMSKEIAKEASSKIDIGTQDRF